MVWVYKNTQFCATTHHVAVMGECVMVGHVGIHFHHSTRDKLWYEIVHFYVPLVLLFKSCPYVTHIYTLSMLPIYVYTLSHVNCGAEITIQYALSVVTKV